MVWVMMVAEKPSICNSIALALSGGNHETHGRTPPGKPQHFQPNTTIYYGIHRLLFYQCTHSVEPSEVFQPT